MISIRDFDSIQLFLWIIFGLIPDAASTNSTSFNKWGDQTEEQYSKIGLTCYI